MTIRGKIVSIIVLVVVAFAASVSMLLWAVSTTHSSMEEATRSQDLVVQVMRVGRNVSEQKRDVREIIVDGMDQFADYWRHRSTAREALALWEKLLREERANVTSDEEKSVEAIRNGYQALDASLGSALEVYQANDSRDAAVRLESQLVTQYETNFLPQIEKVINTERANASKSVREAENSSNLARIVALIVVIACCIPALSLSAIILRDVSSSLAILKYGSEQLRAGNLDAVVSLKKKDEFGALADTFNEMAAALKKSIEEINLANLELKGFAHTVSHDLKAPIATISVANSMLLDRYKGEGPVDGETGTVELLEIIDHGVTRSSKLIDDMLALAEAGQEPKDATTVDVSAAVESVLEERAESIRAKGIEVKVNKNLGTLVASPTHVYQVFSNLIGNAIKHNDSEAPVIEVGRIGGEAGMARFVVRDNGSGIPPSEIEKVFLPFFKGKTGETGIGLATVEKIVKLYGGEVKAYNDDGACFEFALKDYINPAPET